MQYFRQLSLAGARGEVVNSWMIRPVWPIVPMTHLPEISAKNQYQKTGTGF